MAYNQVIQGPEFPPRYSSIISSSAGVFWTLPIQLAYTREGAMALQLDRFSRGLEVMYLPTSHSSRFSYLAIPHCKEACEMGPRLLPQRKGNAALVMFSVNGTSAEVLVTTRYDWPH